MATEKERARMSITRGQVASGMRPGEEKREFISRQSREEARGREDMQSLEQEAYRQRNENAVQGSMRKGGKVRKTGLYRLHRGERVVPKRGRRR
jgi:hypothetical protein